MALRLGARLHCVAFVRDHRRSGRVPTSTTPAREGSHTAMRPLDYLRILRRRWWILVVGALIGSLLAFATRPSESSVIKATAPKVAYRATHTLATNDESGDRASGRVDFDRYALETIVGPIPDAAMKRLKATPFPTIITKDETATASGSSGGGANSAQRERQSASDPAIPKVRAGKGVITIFFNGSVLNQVQVAAVPDPATGALAISATGNKEAAPQVANIFADELLKSLEERVKSRFDRQVTRTTANRDSVNAQLAGIDSQLVFTPDPIVRSQLLQRRTALQTKKDQLDQDLSQLTLSGPDPVPLKTLAAATVATESLIKSAGGTALEPNQRMLVGGGIGLFLALALLVITELLGARIRDVAGTESAARMPVIAEIPVVKMDRADRFQVATSAEPASLTAEAYRSLRTSLLAMWQRHPKNVAVTGANGNGKTNGNGNGHGSAPGAGTVTRGRPLRTLLVTSPGPAEGKSISVVNLAAAFAETGVTVIVIDADFRRPTQTRYFDRPRNPNLGDIDLSCEPEDLEAILQETEVPGVRLAASAPTKSDPGHAIAVAKAAIAAAAQLADLVIVDSPPILLANDAADLALGVDASVLLARSGWTRRSGVVSSADLLRRLEATVIGVVIVGAEHGVRAGYYGYYGYYGYGYGYAHPGEVSILKRLLPWRGARKPQSRPRATVPGPSASPSAPSAPVRPPSAPDLDDPWV